MSDADKVALARTKIEEEYLKRLTKAGSIGSVPQPEPSAVPEVATALPAGVKVTKRPQG